MKTKVKIHVIFNESSLGHSKKHIVKKLEEMLSVAVWQIKHLKNFG